MRFGVLHRDSIKALYEACGRDGKVMAEKITERLLLKDGDPKKLTPGNFSLRELAEGLGGDVRPFSENPVFMEAVTASQFATIVGTLVSAEVMAAYEKEVVVADQLVTKFTSSQEKDKVPGAYIEGSLATVGEGAEYPHTADIKEKYVEIGHQKRGLILDITDEAIRFDRTGLVLRESAKLGERMGRDRSQRIMKTVQDLTGYRAWYPTGTVASLYQNAQGDSIHDYDNLVVDVLADYTDINSLWTLLRLMKDDNADPINVDPKILLLPVALEILGIKIINNDVLAGGTNNERNPFANRFKVLAHPDLDANSSTAWYLGDFQRQFLEKVVIPPQVTSRRMGDGNEDGWRRDIVASYKVRYDSMVGAVDYRFVGKSTGAGS